MRHLTHRLWPAWRPGRLGQNTLLGTTGLGARAVIQAGYLLILSRWLGADGYGLFAGSVAMAVLLAPLAQWGSGLLLTRSVARHPERSAGMWATALQQTGAIGGLLTIIVLGLAAVFLHQRVSLGAMLLLALSELILLPMAQVASGACFALERGVSVAVSVCLVPFFRLAAIATMLLTGWAGTPANAAGGHFAGTVIGLVCAILLVRQLDAWPAWRDRHPLWPTLRRGTPYAMGRLVDTSYREVDKVLMLQMLGATVAGTYTAGFRVVSIFALPVAALVGATLPRLMVLQGSAGQPRTFRAVVLTASGFGVCASLVVALISSWVPHAFGPGYSATSQFVLWLSPWPFLYALHQTLAANLTATDRQKMRVAVEALGTVLVVAINLLLLQRLGPRASVLALLLAEAFMALGCWALARRRAGHSPMDS